MKNACNLARFVVGRFAAKKTRATGIAGTTLKIFTLNRPGRASKNCIKITVKCNSNNESQPYIFHLSGYLYSPYKFPDFISE